MLFTSGFFVFSQLNLGWPMQYTTPSTYTLSRRTCFDSTALGLAQANHIIEAGDLCLSNPALRQLDVQMVLLGTGRTIDQCKPLP
jgi:hypothetical protein